jgi:hypothetical protein
MPSKLPQIEKINSTCNEDWVEISTLLPLSQGSNGGCFCATNGVLCVLLKRTDAITPKLTSLNPYQFRFEFLRSPGLRHVGPTT